MPLPAGEASKEPSAPSMGTDEKREVRKRPSAEVECPRCGSTVTLIEETEQWIEKDGLWIHDEYGPGVGDCCGLVFLDDPWGGIQCFVLEEKWPVPANASDPAREASRDAR